MDYMSLNKKFVTFLIVKLYELLCMVWETEVCPDDWKRGTTVKLSKKGNLPERSKRRGISLLSVPGKLWLR